MAIHSTPFSGLVKSTAATFSVLIFFYASAQGDDSPMRQAESSCQPLDAKQTEEWLKGKTTLVFFASWCHACKPHLEIAKETPDTGLVLVFDRPENGQKVLAKLKIDRPCIMSSSLEERFNVSSLPRTEKITAPLNIKPH